MGGMPICHHLGLISRNLRVSPPGPTYPDNDVTIPPENAWTTGQIVAITVWAVPLFEFVKLSIGWC